MKTPRWAWLHAAALLLAAWTGAPAMARPLPAGFLAVQLGADDYAPRPRPRPNPQQQQQPRRGPSEAETRARILLMQRSMGFGGIFGPTINGFMKSGSGDKGCGQYTDYAACQAHKSGNGWAADRLQNHQSNGSERDWYNR